MRSAAATRMLINVNKTLLRIKENLAKGMTEYGVKMNTRKINAKKINISEK